MWKAAFDKFHQQDKFTTQGATRPMVVPAPTKLATLGKRRLSVREYVQSDKILDVMSIYNPAVC